MSCALGLVFYAASLTPCTSYLQRHRNESVATSLWATLWALDQGIAQLDVRECCYQVLHSWNKMGMRDGSRWRSAGYEWNLLLRAIVTDRPTRTLSHWAGLPFLRDRKIPVLYNASWPTSWSNRRGEVSSRAHHHPSFSVSEPLLGHLR